MIRSHGGRVTAVKRAVLNTLISAPQHLSVETLTGSVQQVAPDTSASTVYRILEELEGLGIVVHSHLGHTAAVYHLSGLVHGHLSCVRCAETIEIPASFFSTIADRVSGDYGFTLDEHHLALSGTCARCQGR